MCSPIPSHRCRVLSLVLLVPLALSCNQGLRPGEEGDDLDKSDGGQSSKSCVNLECKQVSCAGTTTTLAGTVNIPAGTLPLYGAVVYIPNADLQPVSQGASCDRCDDLFSGAPLVQARTDVKGRFALENAPAGDNIPLVVQVGKWRRKVIVPSIAPCERTEVQADLTRLPRKASEGDLPRIALTTGGADVMECLLPRIGIDYSEITLPSGTGHVHLFAGGAWQEEGGRNHPATSRYAAPLNGGANLPAATALWNSVDELRKYDVVLLSCEGQQNPGTKPDDARQALIDYTAVGGRVFASHWHNYWMEYFASKSPGLLTFYTPYNAGSNAKNYDGLIHTALDTSFPKGMALRDWLKNNGALDNNDRLPIYFARRTLRSVNNRAQRWIYYDDPADSLPSLQYVTFNTPVGADAKMQCGRVVFSDLHVAGAPSGTGQVDSPGTAFPNGCIANKPLSAQEKALIFMFFDLSACISSDILG